MEKLVLFCKSYSLDMLRARRLAESIAVYNVDDVSFYLSVPERDLEAFRRCFQDLPCRFVTDEMILAESCAAYGELPPSFPAHLVQQLVKLEFWRLGLGENYIWLDSDSYFIRPFRTDGFFAEGGTPYTVMHEGGDLFTFAKRHGREKIIDDFQKVSARGKTLFGRTGADYDFGPSPPIWSAKVLQGLAGEIRSMGQASIYALLADFPSEIQLYGEYLLASEKIPIVPRGPLFKVFHYVEQFMEAQERGEWDYSWAKEYFGVVMQSNWARLPPPRQGIRRRLARWFSDLH
ncbi:MAG: DUF6492 family protein [Desulfobulbaceae bacterium]|nr:DUF6492 family protein [Desulfobulbaceae bacterium]